MKKFLLLACAALVGSSAMVAEEIDVTPRNYHFNDATTLPIFNHGAHGANIQGINSTNDVTAPIFQNINGAEQWDNGLIVIGGGQYWNHDNGYYNNIVKGLQLVDLGGTVGQVLAWVGKDSNVKEALKEATGYEYDFQPGCELADLNWGNLNFFMDPRNTPTEKQGFIRTTITYHVFSNNVNAVAMNNVQFKTNENGMTTQGGNWTAKGNFGYDEDMEEDVYDPYTWQVYSIEGICPDSEDAKDYFPMRAVLNFPGGMPGVTYFIKDITFTHVTDGAPVKDEAKTSTIKLTYGEPSGVKDVAAVAEKFTYNVNGNTVVFSADAEIYTVAGVKVAAAAAAQSVTLPAGMYIARAAEKAVKFVVK